jgi:hypothetical protein
MSNRYWQDKRLETDGAAEGNMKTSPKPESDEGIS